MYLESFSGVGRRRARMGREATQSASKMTCRGPTCALRDEAPRRRGLPARPAPRQTGRLRVAHGANSPKFRASTRDLSPSRPVRRRPRRASRATASGARRARPSPLRRGGGGGGGECSATLPDCAFAAIAARKKVSLLLFDAV